MGAGASAAEGRVFCHHCGARSTCVVGEAPKCESCGASDGVETTDARLPITPTRGTAQQSSGSTSDPGGSSAPAAGTSRAAMRVESVTVFALHRPEDGSLLLRVLPNVVSRSETIGTLADGLDTEDAAGPPEPVCAALLARLQVQEMSAGMVVGDTLCVICSENCEVGSSVVTLGCKHTFHESCIRRWLMHKHTCPTCRMELEVDSVRYLRSIGLAEEADALEKVEQERQEQEMQKQVASRRRWVESMRRGDPVHFGLVCGHCAATPLVGDCHRCSQCESYILCSECFATREECLRRDRALGSGDNAAAGAGLPENGHPAGHLFVPFESSAGRLAGPRSVPTGHGGLLTVVVPAPAHSSQNEQPTATDEGEPAQGESSLAAAEVAFAAVRSLALAPLVGTSQAAPVSAPTPNSAGGGRWHQSRPRGRG